MADLNDEQKTMFQFLIRHSDEKFATAEIARQLGMTDSVMIPSAYAKLRHELDQLVERDVIESMIEEGETKYFIPGK